METSALSARLVWEGVDELHRTTRAGHPEEAPKSH